MSKPNRERLREILRRTMLWSLASALEDEGIDDGMVDGLTEADLERIGIEKMGDRKLFMDAIKETVGWVKPVETVEVLSSFVGPEMVEVQGGELPGDSRVTEKRVEGFSVGKYEVTWGEWKDVREWAVRKGYDLVGVGAGNGNNYPVTDVSWHSVVKWCNARSEKEGLVPVYTVEGVVYRGGESVPTVKVGNGYRLPSSGEWEWAARGGVKGNGYEYSGSKDLAEVGWYDGNSGGKTHEVGTKKANELGIYDMSGNVWEWCFDWVDTGAYRVFRGGSWYDFANRARVSYRNGNYPSFSYYDFGFRVVRSSVP